MPAYALFDDNNIIVSSHNVNDIVYKHVPIFFNIAPAMTINFGWYPASRSKLRHIANNRTCRSQRPFGSGTPVFA